MKNRRIIEILKDEETQEVVTGLLAAVLSIVILGVMLLIALGVY